MAVADEVGSEVVDQLVEVALFDHASYFSAPFLS